MSHDVLQNIPYVGTKLAPFYSPVEHYMKFQVYGSESALWDQPWSDVIRPAIYETAAAPGPMAGLRGAAFGFLMGHPASPFRAFNPFPAGSMMNGPGMMKTGGLMGSALGWTKLPLTGSLSGGFIPPHVRKQRDTEMYFDKLRYLRARGNEERAVARGDGDMAAAYRREAGSTITGLTSTSSSAQMRRSMSRIDRAYFDAFSEAPQSERNAILNAVPSYIQPLYQRLWGMNSSLSNRSRETADAEAMEYMQSHNMPEQGSMIWHPDVPMQAIKASFLDAGINGVADSFSKFDVYPRMIEETQNAFPGLEQFVPQDIHKSLLSSATSAISSFVNPFDNVKGFFSYGPISSSNIQIYDTSQSDQYLFTQQALR